MDKPGASKARRLELAALAGKQVAVILAVGRLQGMTPEDMSVYVSFMASALLTLGTSMEGEDWAKRTLEEVDAVLRDQAERDASEQAGMN